MEDTHNRTREMFLRVQDFGTAHASDFAPSSLGKQLFTDLHGIVNELSRKIMNRTKILTTFAAALLVVITFAAESRAQLPRPGDPNRGALENARTMIPTASGRAGMVREFRGSDDRLACGPASGNRNNFFEGNSVTIIYSFGQPPSRPPIGSWTVRNIVPANMGRPESVGNYFFSGVFTGGTVIFMGTAPRIFDLRGRTTFVGSNCSAPNAPRDTTVRDVRIWGSCEAPETGINFEITQPTGVYARGTFRHDVSALCGNAQPSSVNQNLNQH